MSILRFASLLLLAALPATALADPVSAVVMIASYAGTYAAATGLTVLGMGAIGWASVAIVASAYGASAARRKAKKAAARARAEHNSKLEDRTVTVLRADPPWQVIYGEAIVGGYIVDIFTTDDTSARKEDGSTYTKADGLKHMVIVLAAHECEAVTDILLDGVSVGPLDGSGWATGTAASDQGIQVSQTDSRQVSFTTSITLPETPTAVLTAYSVVGVGADAVYTPVTVTIAGNTLNGPAGVPVTVDYSVTWTYSSLRASIHLGSDTQTVDTYLNSINPTRYTTNHRLRGLCYAAVTLRLTDQRFQGGPPNLAFRVKGRKVLDTRTSTTAWSRNPALIARDFLTAPWGGEVLPAEVNTTFVNAAANVCDTATTLTVGATVETGQPKYTCDGAFTTEDSPEAVLDDLLESMAGMAVYGAEWQISAGAWTAPVMDLTDDDLAGQIEIVQADAGLDDLFNGIRGQYLPQGTTTPVDFEPYSNSVFVTDDGKELWINEDLPYTNHKARARNLSRIKLEKHRSAQLIRFPAKIRAWPLQVGDRVRVTNTFYGITLKTYRVSDWNSGPTTPVSLLLEEDDSSIWDDADATVADPTPNTDLANPWKVGPMTGVTVASGNAHIVTNADGSVSPRVWVNWSAVTDALVLDGGIIEVLWRYAGTVQWEKVEVLGSDPGGYITGAREGRAILVEVRAVNKYKVTGPSTFVVHTVIGKTAPPEDVAGLGFGNTATGVRIYWTPCIADDYEFTELRYGSTFGASLFFWKGASSEYTVLPPADGVYTVWATHYNRSGVGSTPQSLVVTFTAASLGSLIKLTSSGFAFVFDGPSDSTSDSPTISFDAVVQNVSTARTWEAKAYNAAGAFLGDITLGGTGDTGRTLTPTQFNNSGAWATQYVKVRVYAGSVEDRTTIYRGDNGASTIQIRLTNYSHTVPAGSDGTVISGGYVGSGTNIEVYEGTTNIPYQPPGTANNTWTASVAVTSGSISTGTFTDAGSYLSVGDHSNMTTDKVVLTYTVTGKTAAGVPFSQDIVQDISKSKGGQSIYLARVYRQTAGAPSTPTGGSYNFSTSTLTAPTSPATWLASPPTATTVPTWVSEYRFVSPTGAGTVSAGTWSTPVIDTQIGTDGTSVYTLEIYTLSASAPATPTSTTATYNFSTDTFTAGNLTAGWGRAQPAATTTQTVYRSAFTFTTTTPGTPVTAGAWSAPVAVAKIGADGSSTRTPVVANANQYGITGAWSDGLANRVISNAINNETLTSSLGSTAHLRIGDTVTITNGTTSVTKYWSGSAWVLPGTYVSGDVLVGGTISGGTNLNITGYAKIEGNSSLAIEDPSIYPLPGGSKTISLISNSSGSSQVGVVGMTSTSAGYGVYAYSNANGRAFIALNIGTGTSHAAAFIRSVYAVGLQVYGATQGIVAQLSNQGGSYPSGASAVYGVNADQANTFGGDFLANTAGAALRVRGLSGATALSVFGPSSFDNQITSTLSTGSAPFVVTSTTLVNNLNVRYLQGSDWASPAAIGSTTRNSGLFTFLNVNSVDAGNAQLRVKSASGSGASVFLRNDGTDFYLMRTTAGSPDGSWTTPHSFRLNLSTGVVEVCNLRLNTMTLSTGTAAANNTLGGAALVSKPGSASNNTWLSLIINGTQYYLPVWT